jgi:tRNA pseudouridine38-40 synthase
LELESQLTTYKLTLQYFGKNYFGWQIQKDVPTVQGMLEKSLNRICGEHFFKTLGASRTDRGVHALGQVCKVELPLNLKESELLAALNSLLPEDIRILACEQVDQNFHPIYDAKKKTYNYLFSQARSKTAFQNELVGNCSYPLNFELIKKACSTLVGKHDFVNYFCTGSDVSGTIREIFDCRLSQIDSGDHFERLLPSLYQIEITGSGFLKQMVRLLIGAMWNVGRGEISLDEFKLSLREKKTEKLGPVAPASGLYLKTIYYS